MLAARASIASSPISTIRLASAFIARPNAFTTPSYASTPICPSGTIFASFATAHIPALQDFPSTRSASLAVSVAARETSPSSPSPSFFAIECKRHKLTLFPVFPIARFARACFARRSSSSRRASPSRRRFSSLALAALASEPRAFTTSWSLARTPMASSASSDRAIVSSARARRSAAVFASTVDVPAASSSTSLALAWRSFLISARLYDASEALSSVMSRLGGEKRAGAGARASGRCVVRRAASGERFYTKFYSCASQRRVAASASRAYTNNRRCSSRSTSTWA